MGGIAPPCLTGIASLALPATGPLGKLSRLVALLAGSGDASPAGLMFLGLGLIGLRDRIEARVPRRCLSSSQGLVVGGCLGVFVAALCVAAARWEQDDG